MREITGTIIQLVVIVILLPFIIFLLSWVPNIEEFMDKVFWKLLGTFDLFESAADCMDAFLHQETFEGGNIIAYFIHIISKGILEAFVTGLTILISNEIFTTVENGRIVPNVIGIPLLPVFLGFVVGLAITTAIGMVTATEIQAILYGIVCIALLLIGIMIMLGHTGVRARRLRGYAAIQLINLLIGVGTSVCVACMITALVRAPGAIAAGATWGKVIGWYMLVVFFLAIMCFLLALTPRNKNS